MGFIDELEKMLAADYQFTYTENGAKVYSTTGSALLDMNYAVSSLRAVSIGDVITRFARVYLEDAELAVKWMFYAGDVRGGMGERRLFKACLWYLSQVDPDATKRLLPLVAQYTRWDNLFVLLGGRLDAEVCALIKEQLESDEVAMRDGKPVSLLAKWLPSVQTVRMDGKKALSSILTGLSLKKSEYRKRLSALRAYMHVTERLMSDGNWNKLDYSAVPSKANLIYAEAFYKHDSARRGRYLTKLERGETKINAQALYPYEILHRYSGLSRGGIYSFDSFLVPAEKDTTIESLWHALPDYVNGDSSTICVTDGSASMTCTLARTNVCALEIAMSLAIYFSERAKGPFKDKFITFSDNPQLVDLSGADSLFEKIRVASGYSEVSSTNIEAVFDLILAAAAASGSADDVPDNVLILSDMEFNDCVCDNAHDDVRDDSPLFDVIAARYAAAGVKMPRLIFWNICSRSIGVPLRVNEKGLAFVSGFSPSVCELVLSSEFDPFKCLTRVLNGKRYLPVERAFKGE